MKAKKTAWIVAATVSLFLLGFGYRAEAAIAILDSPTNTPWTGTTNLNQSYLVSSGAKVLVLAIGSKASNLSPTNVTYNGLPMTLAVGISSEPTYRHCDIYYLWNPPTGANTLSATLAGVTYYYANAFTLAGVNTNSTPLTATTNAETNASASVTKIMADLDAPYWATGAVSCGCQPEMEEMLTIAAPGRPRMCGTARRIRRTPATTLPSYVFRQSSSVLVSKPLP